MPAKLAIRYQERLEIPSEKQFNAREFVTAVEKPNQKLFNVIDQLNAIAQGKNSALSMRLITTNLAIYLTLRSTASYNRSGIKTVLQCFVSGSVF
jgi:hypothetical protein